MLVSFAPQPAYGSMPNVALISAQTCDFSCENIRDLILFECAAGLAFIWLRLTSVTPRGQIIGPLQWRGIDEGSYRYTVVIQLPGFYMFGLVFYASIGLNIQIALIKHAAAKKSGVLQACLKF